MISQYQNKKGRENITMSKTKYDAIRIAKQLQYSEDTLQAIANAKTENEISRIMRDARLTQEV